MDKKKFFIRVVPFLVFLIFAFIAFVAWYTLDQSFIKDERQSLDIKTQEIAAVVNEKIKANIDVVYGARGLFSASKSVERIEWQNYVRGLDLTVRHPSISAVSFVEKVELENVDEFVRAVREDKSVNGVGYPNFKINPEEKKSEYYVGKYIEPIAGREQVLGFDFSSDPTRYNALTLARDSNVPVATAVVNLITTNKPGLSIILPVYQNDTAIVTKEERQANLAGFILASLRVDDFFNDVIARQAEKEDGLIFDVFDASGKNALFFSYNKKNIPLAGRSFVDRDIDVADKKWVLRVYSENVGVLNKTGQFFSFGILAGGILLSFFVALTLYFLLDSRRRALAFSEQMVLKALEDKRRFEALFQSSNDAIMTLEPPDWKFTSGNPATFKMFGVKGEKEFVALGPWELSPERQPDGELSVEKSKKMINKAMGSGSVFFDWVHKRYRGEEFAATVLLNKVKYGDKEFLQATVRDVSEQKRNEEAEKNKIKEIERMNELMIGRELKMVELKENIDKLKSDKK